MSISKSFILVISIVAIFATTHARRLETEYVVSDPTQFVSKPNHGKLRQADCSCGQQQNTRIVGGTEAALGEFPWRVRICTFSPGKRGCSSCGASIIASRWLLTAAHCFFSVVKGSYTEINAGGIYAISPNILYPRRVISYEGGNMQNDIALIELNKDLNFNDTNLPLGPICLPYGLEGTEVIQQVIASGWGKTVGDNDTSHALNLQKVTLDVISNDDCRKIDPRITMNQVCTKTRGKSTCQGDSGGSIDLLAEDGESYQALGVVSYGALKCDNNAVYTRVSEYISWIEKTTRQTFCNPNT